MKSFLLILALGMLISEAIASPIPDLLGLKGSGGLLSGAKASSASSSDSEETTSESESETTSSKKGLLGSLGEGLGNVLNTATNPIKDGISQQKLIQQLTVDAKELIKEMLDFILRSYTIFDKFVPSTS